MSRFWPFGQLSIQHLDILDAYLNSDFYFWTGTSLCVLVSNLHTYEEMWTQSCTKGKNPRIGALALVVVNLIFMVENNTLSTVALLQRSNCKINWLFVAFSSSRSLSTQPLCPVAFSDVWIYRLHLVIFDFWPGQSGTCCSRSLRGNAGTLLPIETAAPLLYLLLSTSRIE